jgi:hypothetical protein
MRKIGLSFSCFLLLVVVAMGGCIGYAGQVGPSAGDASTSKTAGIALNPTALSFGSVTLGTNSSKAVSVTNGSRTAVVLSSISSTAASFIPSGLSLPTRIAAGQSVSFKVNFAPRATGNFTGTIAVTDSASGSPATVAVTGTAAQQQQPGIIAANSANLSLGSVTIGSTATQSFSVTNTGGMTAILSAVSSSSAAFTAGGPTFPMDITPGQTVPFTVTFAPTAAGTASGVITVASNASNAPTTIAVNGTGADAATPGRLSVSAASVSMGNVNVGSTGSQTFLVTNTGGTGITLSSLSSSSAAFTASGPTFPMSLAAGQTVSVKVLFAPTVAGNASGTVTLASNASNAPMDVAVTGTGVAPSVAPTISTQPAAQSVLVGQTATFTVAANGTAPLTYQWSKNGTAISGATSASYTTAAETTADNGASFAVSVSNSVGSVTSTTAALAVSAATLSLSASPTSLSFGSVNVGSNSAQSVTFTNSGNSNVTVSNVSVSGAGFNATGVSTGQVVAPGKTASLNVTFTPASSGALTGSVTVTSNAANSPVSVALSGTGASATTSSVSGAPTCGKNNDATNHVPTDWQTFLPPAKGQSYTDPTFGCTVTRVTDASTEDSNGSAYLPILMGYATVSPFNANDAYLMLEDGSGQHFITDLKGNTVVSIANMPSNSNDGWYYWDATNPNIFYYTNGNSMMSGTIQGSSVTATTVHQFTEYTAVNFMDETDVSQDGQHVVLIGGDDTGSSPESVFDYNFVSNLKGPVYTTQSCTGSVNDTNNNCLHKLIQTPDNNVAIDFANDGTGAEQGVRLWDGSNALPHLQDSTDHMDTGLDMNGSPVYIEVGNGTYTAGETNPCPSGWGLDVRQIYDTGSAVCLLDNQPSWHVGYRGNPSQPWVGLSFFDQRTSGPEFFDNSSSYSAPSSSNWQLYEDEIIVVRIDANNNPQYVYRLARAYSRSAVDFDAQPHAAISRDGKYIAFNSDMAYAHSGCPSNFQTGTNCSDVYVIEIK